MWLQFFDYFLFIFHLIFTTFNLLGWIFPKTRKLHLFTTTITAFSWIVLGFFYGFGYCPLTDWHWQIRLKLGHHDMPSSYIKYLIDTLLGTNVNANTTDQFVVVIFFLSFFLSIYFNFRKRN